MRFENDPIFHDKVIKKIHLDQDNEYKNNIKKIKKEKRILESTKSNQIKKLEKARWDTYCNGFEFSLIEGKVRINGTESIFSNIQGADINAQYSYRFITTQNGKSKKHVSIGGALVGNAILGPTGAIIGGVGLGKTTSKSQAVSNSIPTCNHIGVIVSLKGFKNEIVLLSSTVDQSSSTFKNAYNKAQKTVEKLHILAGTNVPKNYTSVYDDQTVVRLTEQIAEVDKKLNDAVKNVPKYELPEKFK